MRSAEHDTLTPEMTNLVTVPSREGNAECEDSRIVQASVHSAGNGAGGTNLVPPQREERDRLRQAAANYVATAGLVPPLSLEALTRHARQFCVQNRLTQRYQDFLMVMLGNALWEMTLAGIPMHRRLLLLPQCLRDRETCPAGLDEFGLLCLECGRCPIGHILPEAESLGYITLVAEGTRMVTQLLERKLVDAVIGIGCLSSLERLFPAMAASALPGLAIPLVRDGCHQTPLDLDWVLEAIRLHSDQPAERLLDLEALKVEVNSWFEGPALLPLLQPAATETEKIACQWVRSGGKRWRPYLLACACQALRGAKEPLPETVRKLAIAVECFHKASLAHDDIEDGDDSRYGLPTLHRRHGLPVALNAGDLLVGEGYRLIAECGAPPAEVARMLAAAARGHRDLCLGQGEELLWNQEQGVMPVAKVLEIFRRKTAPAFEVAIVLGALCAGADEETCRVLHDFSTALGIAYQIRDDLEDFSQAGAGSDLAAGRPTILPALAWELASVPAREELESLRREEGSPRQRTAFLELVLRAGAVEAARQLQEHYRREAFRSLDDLPHAGLKRFLFQMIWKMLGAPVPAKTIETPQAAERTQLAESLPWHREKEASTYVQ